MDGGFFDGSMLQPYAVEPAAFLGGDVFTGGQIRLLPGDESPSDPVIDALNGILQLVAARPAMPSALFVDRVRDAIAIHLRQKQGTGAALPAERRTGLTGWQERRAKACLTAHAGEDAPVAEAAVACKLSYSRFIRAFKITTGQTPHRWLNGYRVELAKDLLRGPETIADIALMCGFADQSHLTRVFAKLVGTPPGNWRRENRDDAAEIFAPELRKRSVVDERHGAAVM